MMAAAKLRMGGSQVLDQTRTADGPYAVKNHEQAVYMIHEIPMDLK
jgi:hypothetical protein